MIEPFVIHDIEIAGGGRIGICRLPGRAGDLEADLRIIAHWPAAIVVSMTERAEGDSGGAAGLAAGLADAGIRHLDFPVRDFGTPGPSGATWPDLASHLHAALDSGANILLHCMGGKGRSGMVTLRLLTERGMAPEAALTLLRRRRPGAVETDAQFAWGALGAESPRIRAGH